MSGNSGKKPKPVADPKTEHHAEQPSDQQKWKGLIHLGSGGGITGACYAVSRLFGEPQDGWIIALGIICAIITTGLVFHDFYPKRTARIAGIVGILAVLAILGIGEWTESVWERRNENSAAPVEAFHATLGGFLKSPRAAIGKMTLLVATYRNGSGGRISQINFLMFLTIENNQPIPSIIIGYALRGARKLNGPWTQLCPVSLVGGQLYALKDESHGFPFNLDNGLEVQLFGGQEIQPHKTISGWTIWQCPADTHCEQFTEFRLVVRDAAGVTGDMPVTKIDARELSPQASLLRPGKIVDIDIDRFTSWNQCR